MALGTVWPGASSSGRSRLVGGAGAGVPPTPVVDVAPAPYVERRWTSVAGELTQLTIPRTIGVGTAPFVVATLTAPPAGHVHVIERMFISTPGAPGNAPVVVVVGDPDLNQTVDQSPNIAAGQPVLRLVDEQPLIVPERQPLRIVWSWLNDATHLDAARVHFQYVAMEA